jgi:hypothetical protein
VTQGLTDHGPADLEAVAEVALHETVARRIVAGADRLGNERDNLLPQRRGDPRRLAPIAPLKFGHDSLDGIRSVLEELR